MEVTLIDGKKTSEAIKQEIAEEVAQIKERGGKIPHLAAILVGNDGGSVTYVNNKVLACEKVGFKSTLIHLEETVTEEELLTKVNDLNNDPDVDGFIVQLPLPKHISAEKVNEILLPEKDVDGFHPVNVGRMVLNLPAYLPATPNGILELLKRYEIETSGKHCVVIGRSNIVGSPMSIMMAKNAYPGNCTVTLCHSRTVNLPEITRTADIIIAAIGIPEFVTADMVKPGAVVIDVGTTR
ncbi:MAG: bifunctional 5,10-methylene-tetrahydrofolate dehydrogenase/5,10-methylene-tetrahydrofolate cyclohydrolase, partial [Bacteroidota bacterium]|nr:bifunctional 5,10-methylene-tetrahydrofolate dehydrogenase/5,10-methylene-tetrahydrofolate cyclohydrolase [Bacteroidota bacterium]